MWCERRDGTGCDENDLRDGAEQTQLGIGLQSCLELLSVRFRCSDDGSELPLGGSVYLIGSEWPNCAVCEKASDEMGGARLV